MTNLHATIKATIDGDDPWFESVPDAVAECRRYFMRGGRSSCTIRQDDLIFTVEISPDWDGERLP